jgi:hypothetical protein
VNQIPKLLSKTKLMRGYQCLKSIYLTVHNKELEPPVSPELQAKFDQGNEVGIEARKHFPGGTLVDNKPWDFFGSLKRTRELLAAHTEVIYEAAFEHQGCYARADIIQYSKETQRWKIFEVKSSTKVKPEHLEDVGLQAWIMANSGLPIEQINILYINNACKFPKLENLFIIKDVTEQLRALYPEISKKVSIVFKAIRSEQAPEIDIGPHCTSPNPCGFIEHCWKQKQIPDLSVFDLPKIGAKKWELYSKGILRLDNPKLSGLPENQQRMVDCYKSGKRFLDKNGIKQACSSWKFPLIFLDFETINPAIPRYDGTSPYQQVPFQFSAHIWPSPESELIHKEYLHTDKSDPRPALIPKLIEACGKVGSIVSYYAQFESGRISEMAEFSSAHKNDLEALLERIVDPLPIVRDFIYDNAFHGSFSLKVVAPSLLGEEASYEGMLIGEGMAAQKAFEEIIDPKTSAGRKAELVKASLEYCGKDTLVMVELVKWLHLQS